MIESQLIYLEPYIRTVTTILMHSLWQSTLIAILAFVVLSIFRSSSARLRYAVSCCAILAVVVATVVTAVAVWPDMTGSAQQTSAVTDQPLSRESSRNVGASVGASNVNDDASPTHPWWSDPSVSRYIFVIWVAGVILFSIYHILGWHHARGFVRRGTSSVPTEWQARFEKLRDELRVKKFVTLLRSSLVKVPCVVGWMKPVILVPVSMFTSLDPSEIEMILVHELAHVRRYDVLINIVQTAMETLFFFNPAIWWLSRQIRTEREDCCDDTAILKTGSRLRYARALANLEEVRMFQTSFNSALTGSPLRRRIQRIVGATKPRFYSSVLSISGMLLIASLIVVVLGSLGGSNDSAVQASEKIEATQTFDPGPGDLRGEWETESSRNGLKILVYGRGSSGMNFALDRDEVAHLIGQGKSSFRIVRDAGTTFLEGTLKERGRKVEGSGEWYFRPDSAYLRFMGRYGLREDDRQKAFSLAIFDVSRKYLAGMEDRGYHGLTVDQLISARIFGISPEIVDEFREAGYSDLSYQELLSMRVQGVSPEDAREFGKLGFEHVTASQLISARTNGLTPEFVKEFREAGFRDLSFNSFVTLRAFNIDVSDFKDCYRHRFMDLSEDNMVWVCGFGITRKDIEEMKELGNADIDSIIKLICREKGR
jgi:beta-lactamase regulating signal transducer with metallopeptidase domain